MTQICTNQRCFVFGYPVTHGNRPLSMIREDGNHCFAIRDGTGITRIKVVRTITLFSLLCIYVCLICMSMSIISIFLVHICSFAYTQMSYTMYICKLWPIIMLIWIGFLATINMIYIAFGVFEHFHMRQKNIFVSIGNFAADFGIFGQFFERMQNIIIDIILCV